MAVLNGHFVGGSPRVSSREDRVNHKGGGGVRRNWRVQGEEGGGGGGGEGEVI
jgi:hypothetical protein